MATKLDTEKPLFLGKTAVRESTTFGQIRKAVHELDKGDGVSYADLEAHMIANFKPGKSENYGPSYVKAYVRDAVNKFGHLSHENIGAEYEVLAPAEKKAAEDKPKKMTKAEQARMDILVLIRDKGEVSDESDLDSTKITTETVMQETKRKQKTVDGQVEQLEKDGLVRTEKVEASTYVFLTPTGLKAANEFSTVTEAPATEQQPEGTAPESAGTEEDTSEA